MSKARKGDCWKLSDILLCDPPGLQWKQRVKILRDVAGLLREIHSKGRSYGHLNSDHVIIFPGCKTELLYRKTSVVPNGTIETVQFDILCLGVLMMELCCSKRLFEAEKHVGRHSLSEGASVIVDRLFQFGSSILHPNRAKHVVSEPIEPESETSPSNVLDPNKKCPLFVNFVSESARVYAGGAVSSTSAAKALRARGDDFEISEAITKEVRELLLLSWELDFNRGFESIVTSWASSVFELCVQCCSPGIDQRPEAEYAEEWLKEVLEEISNHHHEQSNCKVCLGRLFFELSAIAPSIREQQCDPNLVVHVLVPSNLGKKLKKNRFTGSSSEQSDGYDSSGSNDSYMPPSTTQANGGENEMTSKLQSFLKQLDDQQPDDVVNDNFEETNTKKVKWPTLKSIPPEDFQFSRLDTLTVNEFQASVESTRNKVDDVDLPTLEQIESLFVSQSRLDKSQALGLIKQASCILSEEPNMHLISGNPVVVIGDIHGQYYDMLNMFKLTAETLGYKNINQLCEVGKAKLVFLGDYVDRGEFSCEVLFHILALKVNFPNAVYLIRGNHETESVASYFGFKHECESKYGPQVYNQCVTCFRKLPISALLTTPAGLVFACHGGISPNIQTTAQVEEYNRFIEPGMNGMLCDLLWSDPIDQLEAPQLLSIDDAEDKQQADEAVLRYSRNVSRGCSYYYGRVAINEFLERNRLAGIVRAHEVQEDGYHVLFDDTVATVFSAPNYCDRYGNLGAVLMFFSDQVSVDNVIVIPPVVKEQLHEKQVDSTAASEQETDPSKVPVKNIAVGGVGTPFEFCIPLQFQEVQHPEPVQIPNEKETLYRRIQDTCPYMPSTMQGFVESGLALGEHFGGPALRRKSMMTRADNSTASQQDGNQTVSEMQRKRSSAIGSVVRSGARTLSSSKSPTRKKNSRTIRRRSTRTLSRKSLGRAKDGSTKPKKKKQPKVKYRTAAASDKLNEMHPSVVAERFEDATKRLESRLAHEGRTKEYSGPRQSLLDMFDAANKRALTKSVEQVRGLLTKDLMLVEHFASWFTSISQVQVSAITFCQDLQDGVVLCKVLSSIDDSLVPSFHMPGEQWNKTLNEFQKRENILKFQVAFKRAGLREDPFGIADIRNDRLDVMLPCLVAIARLARSKESGTENQDDMPQELRDRVCEEQVSPSMVEQPIEKLKTLGKKKKSKRSKKKTSSKHKGRKGSKTHKKKLTRKKSKPKVSISPLSISVQSQTTESIETSKNETPTDDPQHSQTKGGVKAAMFSRQELVLLELLYTMIDKHDDGLISTDELVAWGVDEGVPLSRDQALRCLKAVDADHDGVIGLDDFLAFAGQLKQLWIHESKQLDDNSSIQS